MVPALILKAWVAERRRDTGAAEDAYRRALELARRVGFVDHAALAMAQLGANAHRAGDAAQAEEHCRAALAMADAASASWPAAHARVLLARVLEETGDHGTAEALYRSVVEWSEAPRTRLVRESLFLVLAGSPAAVALRGLSRLAAARGDASAGSPQETATTIGERDHTSPTPGLSPPEDRWLQVTGRRAPGLFRPSRRDGSSRPGRAPR